MRSPFNFFKEYIMDANSSLFFENFKPIRNKLRELNIFDTLNILREYAISQELDVKLRFLHNVEQGKVNYIMPNELDFLIVNSIIYSSELPSSKSISQVYLRGKILSLIEKIESRIHKEGMDEDVWLWLNSYFHNQSKQKSGHVFEQIYRYYRIFNQQEFDIHFKEKLGIPYKIFILCSFWLYSCFSKKYSIPASFILSINDESSPFFYKNMEKTLSVLSLSLHELRERLKKSARYDNNIFNFNNSPHLSYPIIEHSNSFYCPVPNYLLRQLSAGIYYIIDVPNIGLSNRFGSGFEKYIGEILEKNNVQGYQVIPEITYKQKQNKSSDWIVQDHDSIAFIECKTKRLQAVSKELLLVENELAKDIEDISKGVLQLYKVYEDYLNNQIEGLPYIDNRTFVPIVVTLEEWFAGLPTIDDKVYFNVKDKMQAKDMDIELLNKFKYKIISAAAFERDYQIMAKEGIANYYKLLETGKIDDKYISEFKFNNFFADEFENDFIKPYV